MKQLQHFVGKPAATKSQFKLGHYPIEIAMEILLNAVAEFPRDVAIPYNLACYYCQLARGVVGCKGLLEIDLLA